jgi:hypothetical protein
MTRMRSSYAIRGKHSPIAATLLWPSPGLQQLAVPIPGKLPLSATSRKKGGNLIARDGTTLAIWRPRQLPYVAISHSSYPGKEADATRGAHP